MNHPPPRVGTMFVNRDISVWRAFMDEYRHRPTVTAMILGMLPAGLFALYLGEGASRAFTVLSSGSTDTAALLAHVMGGLLAIGSILAMAGIVRLGVMVELLGVGLISSGTWFYGLGVIIGLGWNGAIAGTISLSYAVGSAGRVLALAREAKVFAAAHQELLDAEPVTRDRRTSHEPPVFATTTDREDVEPGTADQATEQKAP